MGCGGGKTGSGAGGGKAATPFAGNYGGFEFLQLSGPGGTVPVGSFPLSVTIANDGTVVVTDVDGTQYFGRMGGQLGQLLPTRFIASAFLLIPTPPGIQCNPGTVGYIGTVAGITITGNVTGRFLCTVQGRNVIVVLSGAFTATRGAPGAALPGVTAPTAPSPPPRVGGARQRAAVKKGQ